MVEKNNIVDLTIQNINSSGFSVTQAESIVVFMSPICVGNLCKVKIVKV
ncbi:MAG: hypothetical protein HUJ51_04660 [Eggerthellaceae bacterium]|nr:hypothetical protein [Eggerthellaceae bacterium]